VVSVGKVLKHQFQLFSVLKYPNFRLFWFGLVAQIHGQQMMYFTMGWLAFDLTGSPLTLGTIYLLQAIPRIALNLVGGVLADRVDQRLLISLAQGASALILSAIAVLAVTGQIEIWHLIVGSLSIAMVQAFDDPSRQALFPKLLPDRSLIAAAVPVNAIIWQLARIVAPMAAGFVIAATGAGMSFFLSAAGAAIMAFIVQIVRINKVKSVRSRSMSQDLKEGASFAWNHMVFRMFIGTAFLNSVAAMGYIYVMPVFAKDVFHVDARGLGFLFTASGIGATVALLTVSRLIQAFPAGKVILISLFTFACLLVAFAYTTSFYLALGIMVLIGYSNFVYAIGSEIVLQTTVPDELRGRVMGLNGMMWSLILVGGFLLNLIANYLGAPTAVAMGGGIMIVYALLVGLRSSTMRNAQVGGPRLEAAAPASGQVEAQPSLE
jgi:MFS family permease